MDERTTCCLDGAGGVTALTELLVDDPEQLVRMAVGGWFRAAGHRDVEGLRAFLGAHTATMPRVTSRYASEHVDDAERHRYRTSRPVKEITPWT